MRTIALITGKSLEKTDSINKFPTPGMPKKRSTMNDVKAKLARENPRVVITGIKEFRRMCRLRTTLSDRPFALAVLT